MRRWTNYFFHYISLLFILFLSIFFFLFRWALIESQYLRSGEWWMRGPERPKELRAIIGRKQLPLVMLVELSFGNMPEINGVTQGQGEDRGPDLLTAGENGAAGKGTPQKELIMHMCSISIWRNSRVPWRTLTAVFSIVTFFRRRGQQCTLMRTVHLQPQNSTVRPRKNRTLKQRCAVTKLWGVWL